MESSTQLQKRLDNAFSLAPGQRFYNRLAASLEHSDTPLTACSPALATPRQSSVCQQPLSFVATALACCLDVVSSLCLAAILTRSIYRSLPPLTCSLCLSLCVDLPLPLSLSASSLASPWRYLSLEPSGIFVCVGCIFVPETSCHCRKRRPPSADEPSDAYHC